jgi:hypothetical protein
MVLRRPSLGGDRIFENTNLHLPACTSGFTLVGNNTGNYFTTEAAHCANGGLNPVWSTLDESGDPSTDRGYISTNYLTNGDEFDVASFSCNCIGAVWSEGPTIGHNQGTTQDIIGWCDCDPIVGGDELVSFDGATTGQVPDAIVDEKDVCLSSTFFGDGYRRCYMNRARSTSTICQEGDSGGPVYQRAPNYTAYATGTIIGQLQSGGTQYCWYARMRHIINTLNVSLP